ncbi:hypothetical protein GCM10027073_50350 [Streptomyces chlorus]
MEEAGRHVGDVDPADAGALVEGVPAFLDLAPAGVVQAPPLQITESTARAVAIRSSACSSAPQAEHQVWMSASEGGISSFWLLVVFAGCQPHRAESPFPVKAASLRRCCKRAASASRAACTLDEGETDFGPSAI